MPATSSGLSNLIFGVPSKTGYVVQNLTTTSTPALVAEVFNENGVRKHVRYDDVTDELTFEAFLQGATLPVAGSTVNIDGVTYEVLSVEIKGTNKDFKRVTIKGKTSEGI